jgi:hypothetical protein
MVFPLLPLGRLARRGVADRVSLFTLSPFLTVDIDEFPAVFTGLLPVRFLHAYN